MIRSLLYENKVLREEADVKKMAAQFYNPNNVLWVDIQDASEVEVKALEKEFKLHPLAIEDVKKGRQRPKIEEFEKYAYIVAKELVSKNGSYASQQIDFFLAQTTLVSVRRGKDEAIDELFERLKKNPSTLDKGPDFLLYQILDATVDKFFPELDDIDWRIESVEKQIFKETSPSALNDLFKVKKNILYLKRTVTPLREVLNMLSRVDSKLVRAENQVYFRDVYDHLTRINEVIETQRELTSTATEEYLSTVSNSLNTIMKKLTAVTVIIMIPTLIAGVYGMNFKNTPEFDLEHGYYFALGVMLLTALGSFAYFKRRGWL